MTRANFLNFVAISVAFSWEAQLWLVLLKNQVRAGWMARKTDSDGVEAVKLLMLKSESLFLQTGLSWYCLCCDCKRSYSRLQPSSEMVSQYRGKHWIILCIQHWLVEMAVMVTMQLLIDSSQPKSEREKRLRVTNQKSSISWFKDIKTKISSRSVYLRGLFMAFNGEIQ